MMLWNKQNMKNSDCNTIRSLKSTGFFFHVRFCGHIKGQGETMKEEWKDIKGFEGAYMISNYGRVLSLPRQGTRTTEPVLRSISMTHDGYPRVRLLFKGKDKTVRVHRLVAEAFLDNPEGKETVNHIDGNKENNRADNLEWADRHEQMLHAYKKGLKEGMKGSDNPYSKLSPEQVEAIRNEYVPQSKEHGTVALGKKYGVNNSTIGNIVRGVTYA